MMQSIVFAIAGGALIGLAVSWVLVASGRVAGISGVLGGLVAPQPTAVSWRVCFLLGLFAGGFLLSLFAPDVFQVPTGRSLVTLGGAGLLVFEKGDGFIGGPDFFRLSSDDETVLYLRLRPSRSLCWS